MHITDGLGRWIEGKGWIAKYNSWGSWYHKKNIVITPFKDYIEICLELGYEYYNAPGPALKLVVPDNYKQFIDELWRSVVMTKGDITSINKNIYYAKDIKECVDVISGIEAFVSLLQDHIGVWKKRADYKPTTIIINNNNRISSNDNSVELVQKSVEELFQCNLSIPDYQRIYCWEDENVKTLWEELSNISDSYHLGAIILHEVKNNGVAQYNIIDGQQRLVTLTLILLALNSDKPLPLLFHKFESEDAEKHIANTRSVIENLLRVDNGKLTELQILKHVRFSILILKEKSNLDLAFTFFSNQNSKGVKLSDFDLLKAHHLRYIYNEPQAEHLAKNWNQNASTREDRADGREGVLYIETSLGEHIYRLRRWARYFDINDWLPRYIRDEYTSAQTMAGIPPFGERFSFDEKIQGGVHFFAYVDNFIYKYRAFITLEQVRLLRMAICGESHGRYASVIETLLFGYFIKFGEQYISEALYCIAEVMAIHRYEKGRAVLAKIYEHAKQQQIVMIINQSSSPTFFLAEMVEKTKGSHHSYELKDIRYRFYLCMKELFEKINDVKDTQILKMITDDYR